MPAFTRFNSGGGAGGAATAHFSGIDSLALLAEASSTTAPPWREDAVVDAGGSCDWQRVAGGRIVKGDIKAEDIEQGRLGDCYFLASLAALAQRSRPTLERALLVGAQGVFGVRWFVGGRPCTTWVDDRFPCRDGKPVFSHSSDGELWVLLLEKAYAKENGGSYAAIVGGSAGDALADLTGESARAKRFARVRFHTRMHARARARTRNCFSPHTLPLQLCQAFRRRRTLSASCRASMT